jgi:hypothetical protein
MGKIKIPKGLKPRLRKVAEEHGYDSASALADRLVSRRLKGYDMPDPEGKKQLREQLRRVTDDEGYSSVEELVEHWLEEGLSAYEEAEGDPSKVEERLRGLGYIE